MNLVTSGAITMSSQQIAYLVNSRHDKVKQSIERLVARGVIAQPPMGDGAKSGNGVVSREYLVCKRDSFVVVAQLSPEFTAALVDRWQELEKGQPAALPKSFADALRLAADQQEQIEQQTQQLAIAAPKAEFVDKYVEATGLKGFREVCKLLKAGERKFADFLTGEKIMYRLAGNLTPYANHIDAGRFEVKTGSGENGHAFNTSKFTPKGVAYVAGLWNKSGGGPCGS